MRIARRGELVPGRPLIPTYDRPQLACEIDRPPIAQMRSHHLHAYRKAVVRQAQWGRGRWQVGQADEPGPHDVLRLRPVFAVDAVVALLTRSLVVRERHSRRDGAKQDVEALEKLGPFVAITLTDVVEVQPFDVAHGLVVRHRQSQELQVQLKGVLEPEWWSRLRVHLRASSTQAID